MGTGTSPDIDATANALAGRARNFVASWILARLASCVHMVERRGGRRVNAPIESLGESLLDVDLGVAVSRAAAERGDAGGCEELARDLKGRGR
jgi:hypothetical protein